MLPTPLRAKESENTLEYLCTSTDRHDTMVLVSLTTEEKERLR